MKNPSFSGTETETNYSGYARIQQIMRLRAVAEKIDRPVWGKEDVLIALWDLYLTACELESKQQSGCYAVRYPDLENVLCQIEKYGLQPAPASI